MNLKNLINKETLQAFFANLKEKHLDNVYKHVPTVGANLQKVLSIDELGRPAWVRFDDMKYRLDVDVDITTNATEEYIKQNSYGVRFKYADMSGVQRIGNLDLHRTLPIQNGYRGCVEQCGVLQYYLDPDDWRKKSDGTESRLDGYDGNVSIDTFNDFYLNFKRVGDDCEVRMSLIKLGADWIKVPRKFIHFARSTKLNKVPEDMGWLSTLTVNSMVSVVNNGTYLRGGDNNASYDSREVYASCLNKPTTSISRINGRKYCRQTGHENINFFEYFYYFVWPYVIEYASFNSQLDPKEDTDNGFKQGGLGASVSTLSSDQWSRYNGYRPITPNDLFIDCGNKTAIKYFDINIPNSDGTTSTIKLQSHSWHGFPNIFGDIWTNLDGVTVFKKQIDGVWHTIWQFMKNPKKYCDEWSDIPDLEVDIDTIGINSGWSIQMLFDEYGTMVPIKLGGNSNYGSCDYFYNNNIDQACCIVGGRAGNGTNGGLFCLTVDYSVDFTNTGVSLRAAIEPRVTG